MDLPFRRFGRFERHLAYLASRFLGSILDRGSSALSVKLSRGTGRMQIRRYMGRRGFGRASRGARRMRHRAEHDQSCVGDETKGSHNAMLPESTGAGMGDASAFQDDLQIDHQHAH
jgi:hypothetical protein